MREYGRNWEGGGGGGRGRGWKSEGVKEWMSAGMKGWEGREVGSVRVG